MASSPLKSSMHSSISQKKFARASGLKLLETPLVVKEEQLEAVLSAAVQAGSSALLTGPIKHWTSEEQPHSAANLRFVLEWTWKKVISTKYEFDQICVPLFDGSCSFIDPQTLQSLQHCQLLLSNLSTVFKCFPTEAQELTEKDFTDLTNKQVVTGLVSLYAQVVVWFCRSGLLPEGLDDDMHLSRPFYNYPQIRSYYTGHRQKLERLSRGKWDSHCLMIDGMVSQLGERVEKWWRRDEGGTGKYPPASLHALLDLYLLESIEESHKHAITIYFLLDIMHFFPSKTETSVDSFATAFAIPRGLVKLVQGFWLLDHNDCERAQVLAVSASGFPGLTAKSILKSSLHTTAPASPCTSPGQTVTPPVPATKPKVLLTEENTNAKWTAGELPTEEEEDSKSTESVGKQKLKRGRTAKSEMKKASKTTRKQGSWSPPPVEIKLISPFGSPVDGTKSKRKEAADTAKTLRKNKKRLSHFPKPVVRRKML
ncbi:protein ELYS-like isoform X2 [Opisthocomus hoazin]